MKLLTPEIFWHGRDPLYSIDFQFGKREVKRIATCGTDRMIRIWSIKISSEEPILINYLSTLNRHHKSVNVVRFSPNGEILASGGDDSAIILWKLSPTLASNTTNFMNEEEEEAKETWTVFKMLRSHLEDVYDLSWSQDACYLLSGSVDNTAILWDIKKGHKLWMFTDHKSFVQGVSFDPLGTFIATMSSDRACRIYQRPNYSLVSQIKKLEPSFLSVGISSLGNSDSKKPINIFHDDLMKSFFRRLSFSPDGQLLVVPSGCYEDINESTDANTVNSCTFVFMRNNFSKPVLQLPVPSWCMTTLAVRFSPILYKLRPTLRKGIIDTDSHYDSKPWLKYETLFKLAYRMVYAVATDNSVIIYDTQQIYPISLISNIHYHTISDLSWSEDGLILMVSSTDGYCSIITFETNELGEIYIKEKPELDVSGCDEIISYETVQTNQSQSMTT